mgnify:CR=1 FL=1
MFFNLTGIKDQGIDKLIEVVRAASSRDELNHSIRALDRVLRNKVIWVPQWFKNKHTIAYFDMYEHPKNLPPQKEQRPQRKQPQQKEQPLQKRQPKVPLKKALQQKRVILQKLLQKRLPKKVQLKSHPPQKKHQPQRQLLKKPVPEANPHREKRKRRQKNPAVVQLQ